MQGCRGRPAAGSRSVLWACSGNPRGPPARTGESETAYGDGRVWVWVWMQWGIRVAPPCPCTLRGGRGGERTPGNTPRPLPSQPQPQSPLGRLCGGCLSPNGTRHMRAPDLHPAWGGGTSVWAAVLGPGAHRVPRMGRKHISSAAWNPLGQAFQPEPCTAVRCPWTPGCSTFLPSETRDGPVTG